MSDTAPTKTDAPAPKPPTLLKALNQALSDAMADDDKVIVLGEDIADPEGGGVIGVTRGLSTKFGDKRVRSTPITEQAIMGAAIGASLLGYKPVAEIMLMNFVTVAMDMIVNHAAKLRYMSGGQTSVPIVIRTMTGTGLGNGGQHSDYLEAWFAHTPGIKVVCPSTPSDAYGLMRSAINDPDPVIFIENLMLYGTRGAFEHGHMAPLGKARIARVGDDLTIVTYSRMVRDALKAADILANEGISVEVIDLRTISPWDRNAVMSSVAKTNRLLIVHEAVKQFGVGSEIAAEVSRELYLTLKAPVDRLGGAYCPVPFAKPLEDLFAPDALRIADAARRIISEHTSPR